MRLVQFMIDDGARAVARVSGENLLVLNGVSYTTDLARDSIRTRKTLEQLVYDLDVAAKLNYKDVIASNSLLPPVDARHPQLLQVTGTGLTHRGSIEARDAMHAKLNVDFTSLSDSMKIFKMGLEGGKPTQGEIGVQPEWFWKGDGTILRASGQSLESPQWARNMGEEPEIAGLYFIGEDGQPFRLGYALANEMSDHVMERENYLYLAHSKLRPCSLGPELFVGTLPGDVKGFSRIFRNGELLWQKEFVSGESNMTHALSNLEHHHFKYPLFRQPGQIHVHLFGTATISFADGIILQDADIMEIDCPIMGAPLRNPVKTVNFSCPEVTQL
ncbi:AraD1 family protein [Roseibium sp. RKSG952]|uniref:AraD1 family protein n=1 Tax=Roseibium sp. RKSG952 TaxID=2529384 RepID=UPI0012BBEAA4|nr:AraD1 family protein [Roseibium sp. RKSG952]MTH95438.1 hypothetical protein [Roseibium sp. RKSG952]